MEHETIETFYRPCNLCESMCGLEIRVRDGKILSIQGDPADPFSQGHICPKALALKDLHEDPDRLRHPVRRVGKSWKQVDWKTAINEVAENILRIQKKHGRDSVAFYIGSPAAFNYGVLLYLLPFIKALHTKNRYSTSSLDQLPLMVSAYLMFGHQALLPVPDLDRCDFFLIIGSNPLTSMGSIMSSGHIRKRLESILKRGGKIMVIDPRKTATAQLAGNHYFIYPGTDALFLLAVIHTIFEKKRDKMGLMENICNGADALQNAVSEFPPERVENLCGIRAIDIRRIALEFASAKSAACYGRMGTCGQEFGTISSWLIYALNIITGNIDRPGSLMFSRPAADLVSITAKAGQVGHLAKWHSRVSGLPEFSGELPAVALPEEILTPGDGQVRALITLAANPGLSIPNSARTEKAFKSLDFMASIDFYINETTRHAHVILPPASPIASPQFHLACQSIAVRNTVKYGLPVFKKEKGERFEWEILKALTLRLEKRPLNRLVLRHLRPDLMLDLLIRRGYYGSGFNPFSSGLNLNKIKKAPHGIDLGPLEPCLPKRLYTRDKRIQLAPEQMINDLKRLKDKFFASIEIKDKEYDLLLIGRRELRTLNWWTHNYPSLMKGKSRFVACMNPLDAQKRGIGQGDRIDVISAKGSLSLLVKITENIMPGVISIPHGWGHDRPGTRLSVAKQHAGACLNDITGHEAIDRVCGMAALNGVPVRVRASRDANIAGNTSRQVK